MLQKRERRNERIDNFGRGSVMMWDAISYAQTQLVHIHDNRFAARYRDEVLTPNMLPAMNLHRDVFQHDNTRPHTARTTVDFLAVTVLPWPFKSLDLNLIDHLWMTWIDACTVVNERCKLCKNCSRLLSKNGGEFRNIVFVD